MRRGMWSVAIVGVMLTIAVSIFWLPISSSANDAPGCEGLSAYESDMLVAADAYASAFAKAGVAEKNALTLSSDDWGMVADIGLQLQRDLKAITPPAWAKLWHEKQIERAGLIEQIARTAASAGVTATLIFGDAVDAIEQDLPELVEGVGTTCGDFAVFAEAFEARLDGDGAGTPAASPTASPAS